MVFNNFWGSLMGPCATHPESSALAASELLISIQGASTGVQSPKQFGIQVAKGVIPHHQPS